MAYANKVSNIKSYPTPLVADLAFFEIVDSSLPQYKTFKKGQAHWDSVKYPNHFLAHVSALPKDYDGKQIWHYVCDRAKQDLYNWEYDSCSIGGDKFDAVTRTYVIRRDAYDPYDPAIASAMPVFVNDVKSDPQLDDPDTNDLGVDVAMFDDGFILVKKSESRFGDPEMDSLYVVEKRQYIKRETHRDVTYDEEYSGSLSSSKMLYYKTEVPDGQTSNISDLVADDNSPFWGLQADGIVRMADQISSDWFLVTEKQAVPSFMISTGRSIDTTIDYNLPPVLSHFQIDIWNMRKGGSTDVISPKWKRDAYSGPCKATITERFYVSPPSAGTDQITSFQPKQINIQTPIAGFSSPPCLHGNFIVRMSTGTNHPDFVYTAGVFTEEKTTPTDWPATKFIDSIKVQPKRGGFLKTVVEIYPPSEDDNTNPSYDEYNGSVISEIGDNGTIPSIIRISATTDLIADGETLSTNQNLIRHIEENGKMSYYSRPETNGDYWNVVWDGSQFIVSRLFYSTAHSAWLWASWTSADDVELPHMATTWIPYDIYDYVNSISYGPPTGTIAGFSIT